MSAPNVSMKLDLREAAILIVEGNENEQDILAHVLAGFGSRSPRRSDSNAHAMSLLEKDETFDLMIVDQALPGASGMELVRWLRRNAPEPMRTAPVILLSGHTRRSMVTEARDCGANFVVTKPISPQILFDRITWLGKRPRPFIECDSYIGPCRRFKAYGPPAGVDGRRRTDLSGNVGDAKDDNMSQDDIDAMFGISA